MTAINVIQTNDAVHFFSDGAFIDPRSAHITAIGQKVFPFPAARCAIGITGPIELCRHIGMAGQLCVSIDQIVADLEDILPEMIKIVFDGGRTANFDIYIGGFSPAGERKLFKLNAKTSDRAFKFIQCDADCWNYSPHLTPHSIRLALGDEKGERFDRGFIERLSITDPIAHGMLALEAQRRIKVCDAILPGGAAYTVGAFAQVTTVKNDGIDTRILKWWPDRCGSPIAPDCATKVYQSGFGRISYQPRQAVGFKSTDGIDTGSSSNYLVNTVAGYVAPTVVTGSEISRTDGTTIGNMTERSGIAAVFDGTFSKTAASSAGKTAGSGFVGKDYGAGVTHQIGRFLVYAPSNSTYTANGGGSVTIELRGDNSAPSTGSEGTLLYSSTATQAAANIHDVTTGITASPFRYIWVRIVQSGAAEVVITQVRFFEVGTVNDMTLVTVTRPSDHYASHASVLLEYDASASPTLNTDLTVEVTCDGGLNWTSATLVKFTSYLQDDHHGAETELATCTPGMSVAARIKTLNNKSVPIYGLALQWV